MAERTHEQKTVDLSTDGTPAWAVNLPAVPVPALAEGCER